MPCRSLSVPLPQQADHSCHARTPHQHARQTLSHLRCTTLLFTIFFEGTQEYQPLFTSAYCDLYKQRIGNAVPIAAKNAEKGRKFTAVRQNLLHGMESSRLQRQVKLKLQTLLVGPGAARLFSRIVMAKW